MAGIAMPAAVIALYPARSTPTLTHGRSRGGRKRHTTGAHGRGRSHSVRSGGRKGSPMPAAAKRDPFKRAGIARGQG